MAEKVYRSDGDGGRGVRELAGGALLIPSFSDPEKSYKVHADSGYCSCPAYEHKGICIKHITLGEAIQTVRTLKFGARIAEDSVTELCMRIFAPLKGETCRSSYDLLLETMAYRHSTDAMIRVAHKRHDRILSLHERRAA